MKFCDVFKLVIREYSHEKLESIFSIFLQIFIYVSVFFLFTISGDIDGIFGKYLLPIYEDGYEFNLVGYTKADVSELEEMGFRDITFDDSGDEGYGVIDELDNIWIYKLKAVMDGKDIWNEDLDDTLGVMAFCQIMTGSLGIVMFIIMFNNLSNAISMKLLRRKRYIYMLDQLGCSKKVSQNIFYIFFVIRNICALFISVIINYFLVQYVNDYMAQEMYILTGFKQFEGMLIGMILLISICVMWISFKKQWRKCYEN